jgi:hypothetical protein
MRKELIVSDRGSLDKQECWWQLHISFVHVKSAVSSSDLPFEGCYIYVGRIQSKASFDDADW